MEELEIVNFDEIEQERRQNPKPPWKNARRLHHEKAAEFLTPEDIYNKINSLKNIRDKCLLVMLYITAGRVEELVRRKIIRYHKKKVRTIKKGKTKIAYIPDYSKPREIVREELGIKKSDITVQMFKERKIILIKMRNLKNKQPGFDIKLIPFPLESDINKKLFEILRQYLFSLYPEEELFQIGKRRAEQIVNTIGFNPHFFRTCRLTHLVKYNNFSDQKLKTFAGWSDSRPSKRYININWEDLVNSM